MYRKRKQKVIEWKVVKYCTINRVRGLHRSNTYNTRYPGVIKMKLSRITYDQFNHNQITSCVINKYQKRIYFIKKDEIKTMDIKAEYF